MLHWEPGQQRPGMPFRDPVYRDLARPVYVVEEASPVMVDIWDRPVLACFTAIGYINHYPSERVGQTGGGTTVCVCVCVVGGWVWLGQEMDGKGITTSRASAAAAEQRAGLAGVVSRGTPCAAQPGAVPPRESRLSQEARPARPRSGHASHRLQIREWRLPSPGACLWCTTLRSREAPSPTSQCTFPWCFPTSRPPRST